MIKELLKVIIDISAKANLSLLSKDKTSVERFVSVGNYKVRKVAISLLKLYETLEFDKDYEFAMGILLRSMLMDMILMFEVKFVYIDYKDKEIDEFRKAINDTCFKLLVDGTSYIISSVEESNRYNQEDKKKIIKHFLVGYESAFDFSKEPPKLKKEFKVSHSSINTKRNSKEEYCEIERANEIYGLYSFYSKYDHLSNWTAIPSETKPIETLQDCIDYSIILLAFHLEELLLLMYDFNNNKLELKNLAKELESYLKNHGYS